MRFNVLINQQVAISWGLNSQQAILFAFVYGVPSWANAHIENGEVWFNLSKTKICQELPILTDKPDTAYRMLKQLDDFGVIKINSFGNKTYIQITEKGRQWDDSGSEKNPIKVGEISDLGSEKNPTNKVINISSNKNTKSLAKSGEKTFSEWAKEVTEKGEKLIPDDNHIFDTAQKMGIPDDYLFLAWHVFKDYYTTDNLKKYKDWRIVFSKAVKGDWLKLWAFNREGQCYLTPKGKMHQNAIEAAQ
jgi:predicted transcriptional regulator